MAYTVKEIFYTLQGEGANAGRPAIFCRFSGCNLWSGREDDRIAAICQFCDTDFVGTNGKGGGKFQTAGALARTIASFWPRSSSAHPFVVLTGGEPLLQLDSDLLQNLHQLSCTVAVETNGTMIALPELDWICVSPKAGTELKQRSGNELKLVHPQDGIDPEQFLNLPFKHYFLQPKDGLDRIANTSLCIEYCLGDPRWRLSLQTHKVLNIP